MVATIASEWTAIANAYPISVEELPVVRMPEEQAQSLRGYLALAHDSGEYECYECVERILAKLEAAETSPFMDA